MLAFRAKRELHCIFFGKKGLLLHPNTAQRSFFSHYNLFPGKLKETLAQKALVSTERVYRIVRMARPLPQPLGIP